MYIAKICVACGSKNLIKSPSILMPFIADRVFDWGPVEISEEWGIRCIKSGIANCRVNSIACVDCSTIFLDLRFGDEEIERLYRGYRGEEYNTKRVTYEPEYRKKLQAFQVRYPYLAEAEHWIKQRTNPKTVLDWGGDSGFNSMFKDAGSKLYIFDVSGVSLEDGIKSFSKDGSDVNFDLITCNQVLEHVPDPLEVLNKIDAMMASGTWLYFDLPFENIMKGDMPITERLKLKRHWHEHINFFTADGIKKLVNRAKLKFVDLRVVSASNNPGKDMIFQVLCRKRLNSRNS